MEAFRLLQYWKRGASSTGGGTAKQSTRTVTVIDNDSVSDGSDNDDGPFIDLDFALPDDNHDDEEEVRLKVEEREIVTEIDDVDETDLLVQVDGSDTAAEIEEIIHSAAANSKSGRFPVTVSIAKSATKLGIFMSGLKRSKSESNQIPHGKIDSNGKNSKFMAVRLKMKEVKAPKSLLTRGRSNSDNVTQIDEKSVTDEDDNEDEKKKKNNKKEVVQRYLKLVRRPSHVKVSNKISRETDAAAAAKSEKRGLNNLKVMAKKHLGKSKSAVVHSMPSSRSSSGNGNGNGNGNTTSLASKKTSNDWLLQQQDGIQGAILHCKRSFNSSEGGDDTTSEPSHEKKFSGGNGIVAG